LTFKDGVVNFNDYAASAGNGAANAVPFPGVLLGNILKSNYFNTIHQEGGCSESAEYQIKGERAV
jgi:hypothetical protein